MRANDYYTPVIILTGVSDVDLAVKAMKQGAFDYLTKPVDDDRLLEVMEQAIRHSKMREEIESEPVPTHSEIGSKAALDLFPTQDSDMIRVIHAVEKMADSDLCIFIWGESGAGKENLARAIHAMSPRAQGPFIAVNAGQNPKNFATEFFGVDRDWAGKNREKPGFLEAAEGGTIFLDEIEHLSMPIQIRVRRFIQNNEFYRENSTTIRKANVRLIASSQVDLTADEFRSSFSRDLLYHLMINSVHIPSLRDRPDDIPLLANHILKAEARKAGRSISGFQPELLKKLGDYDFPDNIQELKNIIAAAVLNEEGPILTCNSLPRYVRETIERAGERKQKSVFVPRPLGLIIREHVSRTLDHFSGDREAAAKALGITVEHIEEVIG